MKKKKQVKRHSKGKKGKKASPSSIRRIVRNIAIAIAAVFVALCAAGAWYASHSAEWLAEKNTSLPRFVSAPLLYFGDRTIYMTDGLGITGHDVVYDFDEPPPEGRVFFAGAPVRTGSPAPTDITVLDLDNEYTIDSRDFLSKGKSTPFDGWRVRGRVVMTLMDGKAVYNSLTK